MFLRNGYFEPSKAELRSTVPRLRNAGGPLKFYRYGGIGINIALKFRKEFIQVFIMRLIINDVRVIFSLTFYLAVNHL